MLGEAAKTAVAISKVDGSLVEWGAQMRCDAFRADGDGARTIWYLSKALNYVMKDTAREAAAFPSRAVWSHHADLAVAARSMRCSPGCKPQDCRSRVHDRYGSRSHVVSASRSTRTRSGWSFTGLTRTVQRRLRREWFEASCPESSSEPVVQVSALESLASRLLEEVSASGVAVP